MFDSELRQKGADLMDSILEREAEKAGLTRSVVLEEIVRGITEEDGNTRFNYTKLGASIRGMLKERIEHSGSVGIPVCLTDEDRANSRRLIEADMRQAIPASHTESVED